MVSNPAGRIRAGAAAVAATAVVLLVVAGLGNQALRSWRTARADSGNHWIANVFTPLLAAGWRFTAPSGPDGTAHWLAPLVFNLVFVLLTLLFAISAARGRGRLHVLTGVWGAVILAGAIAGIAATSLAYRGLPVQTADAYRDLTITGLTLGFLVGVPATLLATLVAGGGKGTVSRSEPAPSETLAETHDWPITG
jgi:hypothetical protein